MTDDVGSLLLRAGLVGSGQLEGARLRVRNEGGTVPEHLVHLGYIDDEALTSFYRTRLLITRINPSDLTKLGSKLLQKVPADMAVEYRSIPVSLDLEGNLTLVMSDPSDTEAVDEIGFFTGSYVMRAIATQAQIAWCLAHYYKQKTSLYLGLIAEGQWPESNNILKAGQHTIKRVSDHFEAETAPISVRAGGQKAQKLKAKRARALARAGDSDLAVDSRTTPLHVRKIERPSNQQPSPPELFARSGEIVASSPNTDRLVGDAAPAVVISLGAEEPEAVVLVSRQKGSDTAPILLTALREQNRDLLEDTGPIVLRKKIEKRRVNKKTNVGIGGLGLDSVSDLDGSNDSDRGEVSSDGETTEVNAERKRTRITDLVGGDWGAPGTTIPPGLLGPFSASFANSPEGGASAEDESDDDEEEDDDEDADTLVGQEPNVEDASDEDAGDEDAAVPVAIFQDEIATSQMRAAEVSTPVDLKPSNDETVRSEAPDEVKRVSSVGAASQILLAVRAIDRAEDKASVVEPILSFLDLAFERTGFLAVRKNELTSWRLHGCPDGSEVRVSTEEDSTLRDAVRTRLPYNGPLEDAVTKRLAGALDIPDALDLLILPVSIRERVIGLFFGLGSFEKLYENQVTVLSQAAAEAFERIVLKSKEKD